MEEPDFREREREGYYIGEERIGGFCSWQGAYIFLNINFFS